MPIANSYIVMPGGELALSVPDIAKSQDLERGSSAPRRMDVGINVPSLKVAITPLPRSLNGTLERDPCHTDRTKCNSISQSPASLL